MELSFGVFALVRQCYSLSRGFDTTRDRNLERRDPFFFAYPQQTQKVGLEMCYSELPGRWLSVTQVKKGPNDTN